MSSFRDLLIALCAERGVAPADTADLTGEELEATEANNKAIEQLFDEINALHQKMSKSKSVPEKKAPAKKAASKKVEEDDEETEEEEQGED